MTRIHRILILGGTTEARELAARLAAEGKHEVTVSLAGRVKEIVPHAVPVRIGGFGGIDGLAAWLEAEEVDLLIDATHPFAEQMSRNAVAAAVKAGVRLLALRRPPWTQTDGDRWREVDGVGESVAALGGARRRVFLAIGRQEIDAFARAPQHFYLVRSIDRVTDRFLDDAVYLEGRGPFRAEDERALMEAYAIDTVVARNSGGDAGYAKIAAARALGVEVILIRPPNLPNARTVATVDEAVAWIAHPGISAAARGV
ncbi:MAG TPA: cobalt-precorrin-6A reductase [Bauldia sp.]|nr:cobalt-precorrin-6A reductase [Bauldia sp.]